MNTETHKEGKRPRQDTHSSNDKRTTHAVHKGPPSKSRLQPAAENSETQRRGGGGGGRRSLEAPHLQHIQEGAKGLRPGDIVHAVGGGDDLQHRDAHLVTNTHTTPPTKEHSRVGMSDIVLIPGEHQTMEQAASCSMQQAA